VLCQSPALGDEKELLVELHGPNCYLTYRGIARHKLWTSPKWLVNRWDAMLRSRSD
jgi:hypothetical protein